MKKIILLCLVFLPKVFLSQINGYQTPGDGLIEDIGLDSDSNLIYTSGYWPTRQYISKADKENGSLIWRFQMADSLGSNSIQIHKKDIYTLGEIVVSASASAVVLSKIDGLGNLVWSKKITALGAGVSTNTFLVAKNNQIYIAGGACYASNYILSLDSNGNVLWLKSFSANAEAVASLKEDASGNILAVSVGGISNGYGFYAFMIDNLGNIKWNGLHYGLGIAISDRFGLNKVRQDNNKNIYFYFNLIDDSGDVYNVLYKLDSAGNYKWSKYYQPINLANTFNDEFDVDGAGNIYLSARYTLSNNIAEAHFICKIDGNTGNVLKALVTDTIQPSYNDTLIAFTGYEFTCIKYVNANEIILGGGANINSELTSVSDDLSGLCQASPIIINAINLPAPTAYSVNLSPTNASFQLSNSGIILQAVTVNRIVDCNITAIATFNEKEIDINVYPNPSNGPFTIETRGNEKPITLMLYDITGKLVLQQSIIDKTTINTGNLSSGIYNLSLISNGAVINKRLIIEK